MQKTSANYWVCPKCINFRLIRTFQMVYNFTISGSLKVINCLIYCNFSAKFRAFPWQVLHFSEVMFFWGHKLVYLMSVLQDKWLRRWGIDTVSLRAAQYTSESLFVIKLSTYLCYKYSNLSISCDDVLLHTLCTRCRIYEQ